MENSTYTIGKVEDSISAKGISDLVQKLVDMKAKTYYQGLDRWMFLHIKNKPRFIPKRTWYYLLSKILVLSQFDIPKNNYLKDKVLPSPIEK